jgi:signal peptidase I
MATPTTDLFPDADPLPPKPNNPSGTRSLVEWLVVVVGAIIVALVIKTFVMQAFFIPSESMVPLLQKGDRVLVNKLSYHLHDINRGDVVVFERPDGETDDQIKDLIKRVIALPGEKVVIKDNHVYVDDKQLDEPYLPAGTTILPGPGGATWSHKCTPDDPCVVPQGSVWVMGDNRTNSKDSRYLGPIPEDKIVGRAFVIVWPFDRASGM